MPRPYSYVRANPAQNERFGIYGIPKREKCTAYCSTMGEHEVRLPKPWILVQGILCGYCGENTKAIKEYIANPLKQDKESDQLS